MNVSGKNERNTLQPEI